MARAMFAWMILALVATAAGCRICASPYDYSSPTLTGACGDECSPNARSGSILSGYAAPFPDDGYLHGPMLYGQQEVPHDDEMADGVILSVTDRKVDEASPDEPQLVAQQTRPLPSQGWTAVKRTETGR